MRRILIFIAISLESSVSSQVENPHLQALRAAYPYALLTNDYEILNLNDLKTNARDAYPTPFSEKSISYPYWQCFEVKSASTLCDVQNPEEHPKIQNAIFVIAAKRDGNVHEFLSRRAIDLDDCLSYRKDWDQLTQKQKYVCVSGPFIPSKGKSKEKWSWIFDRFKTKKGCSPYFSGGCN